MKVKYIYCCGLCGKEFDNQKSCEEHEKRHIKPLEIVDACYSSGRLSPEKVGVKMEDGSISYYNLY